MTAFVVVVLDVLGEHVSQMPLAEDEQAVEALGLDRADETLRILDDALLLI